MAGSPSYHNHCRPGPALATDSEGGGTEDSVLSSPSLFYGSPPNRVANPVVFDSRFGRDRPSGPVGHFPAIHSSLNSPILCL
ncbi:hypothetical protein ZIOFF_007542 [Zingiber officinale]|uniref:Uncharacterized protein n=1 Tax=Zingiber officinale TaxID=94328 RepID=A0A8J5LWK2_ZINOF|nr:hypothetical protein ZIOFF_007542 [Zingiber officinale]